MTTENRFAPIFPVRDLDVALDHYERLGFAVRKYPGGGYGFATRNGVELHLGVVPEADHHAGSAYLFVDDADTLAAQWRAAGAQVHDPQDTDWGRHEGAVVDPDGNVIRFGSPIPPARASS
jgi:predicted enzyme related to lactoylglutathione lyase